MAARTLALGAISTVLLIAFSTVSAPAAAQTGFDRTRAERPGVDRPAAAGLTEITVVAPRITHQLGPRARTDRGRVEVAEQRAYVSFADLDLTHTPDLYLLEARIQSAATRVCNDLAEQFPHGSPTTATCVSRAMEDAMELAHMIVREEAALAAVERRR